MKNYILFSIFCKKCNFYRAIYTLFLIAPFCLGQIAFSKMELESAGIEVKTIQKNKNIADDLKNYDSTFLTGAENLLDENESKPPVEDLGSHYHELQLDQLLRHGSGDLDRSNILWTMTIKSAPLLIKNIIEKYDSVDYSQDDLIEISDSTTVEDHYIYCNLILHKRNLNLINFKGPKTLKIEKITEKEDINPVSGHDEEVEYYIGFEFEKEDHFNVFKRLDCHKFVGLQENKKSLSFKQINKALRLMNWPLKLKSENLDEKEKVKKKKIKINSEMN